MTFSQNTTQASPILIPLPTMLLIDPHVPSHRIRPALKPQHDMRTPGIRRATVAPSANGLGTGPEPKLLRGLLLRPHEQQAATIAALKPRTIAPLPPRQLPKGSGRGDQDSRQSQDTRD